MSPHVPNEKGRGKGGEGRGGEGRGGEGRGRGLVNYCLPSAKQELMGLSHSTKSY